MSEQSQVTPKAVQQARRRLQGIVRHTPIQRSRCLSELTGADIYLKLENMQRTGSFKLRGAYNMLSQLSEEEGKRGVVAASAGNHAQGVALAAASLGYPSTIVMPVNAPLSKIEATEGYGGKVLLHGLTYDEAYEKALKLRDSHGYTLVHAFNNRNIIAGQGTIGLELLEDLPEVEVVIVPVGGGGLISGCAVALHGEKPELQVFGIEPAGAASMKRSLDRGVPTALQKVSTIADGIAVKRPGELTFELVREHVARTVEVEDSAIAHAMTLLLERSKLVVEGAGAAGVAALVAEKLELKGRKVAVVLSGGNVDLNMLSQVVARGLGAAGRYLRFFTDMPDRPGALAALLKLVAELEANVVSVEHERLHSRVELGRTGVDILVETRSYAHRQELLDKLVGEGYDVRVVDIVPPQDKLNRQC